MSRPRERVLLLLLVLALVAGGGAAAWLLSESGPAPGATVALDPGARPAPAPAPEPLSGGDLAPLRPRPAGERPAGETSVIHALEVELSLVERATFEDEDTLPIGSGADAGLRGRVLGLEGEGIATRVEIVAGASAGRVLDCDSTGRFGASNLYPGLAIVRVEGPGGALCEREVSLVSGRMQDLNPSFARPASVFGSVTDLEGNPVAGATVRVDGKEVFTDEQGEFAVRRVTAGAVLCVVRKEGYAHYREVIGVARGAVVAKDRVNFRLAPGCRLDVLVDGAAGGPGPATVFLLPGGAERVNTERGQRTFPWYLVSPIEVHPGSRATVEGLQEGRLNLMVFRPGAVAAEGEVVAKLVAGRENQVALPLVPGRPLVGRVLRAGEPVRGARVVLEAPDRTRATLAALRRPPATLHALVLPHLPAARQEVLTDTRGLFRFTSYAGSERYYLTASDGEEWRAARTVAADESDVELSLERVQLLAGELTLRLPGRFQGLPIEVRVDGAPRDPFLLRPEDDLRIEGLERGTWRVDVRWHDQLLLGAATVRLGERARLDVTLPEGAILGQTEEERRRAGL